MSILAPGRNLVLVGMMGTGKSTVGRILAGRLQRPFVDTDEEVEAATGLTVAELFATRGERRFRDLEAERIRSVSALKGQVIAVGGGAILDPANVTQLRGTGDLVLLDADPQELATRIAKQDGNDPESPSRPLLAGAHDPAALLAEIRAQRDLVYLAAASYVIDTTGAEPEDVAERVLEWAVTIPGLLTREERVV